jgi:uncharacterized protein YecE (DUF72 family)
LTRARGRVRIGTSGYQYADWRGRFYPEELARKDWLSHYAEHFDTVEINNTFYNLPESETFDHWRERVPRGFCFALKLSRYATHMKRLRDPEEPLGRFLERAERLGPKLGPILVQLPPRWGADPERLAGFLEAAPRRHRWVVEFRDESWLCEEVYAVLREHGAALCVHDMLDDHPRERTADWTYLRFHGTGKDYSGGYSPQKLTAEARRIERLRRRGVDVFAYFNNDVGGHAVENAGMLKRYLGLD